MKFTNPKVPEGINVSRHSPLADLLLLLTGAVALFGAVVLGVYLLGGALARQMPMSWETALAESMIEGVPDIAGLAGVADPAGQAVGAELQALADRLSARMSLPEGLRVTAHYLDDDEVNAFATLGGHVFVLRGLLERLPNENALAMLMAHEIAHAANRDPVSALGGGALLQLCLSVILGSTPDSLEGLLFGPNALLLLAFSREAEVRADRDALAAVTALYGHAGESRWLFETMLQEATAAGAEEPPAMLSTHPLSRDRIAALEELAEARGWAFEGPITPLTPAIAALGGEP